MINRNDDLYKATTEKYSPTSSTLVPLIDRNLYKRPAPGSNSNTSPNSRTKASANKAEVAETKEPQRTSNNANNNADDDFVNPSAVNGGGQRSPNRPLRRPRPHRRRRPQYDYYYYDEDYEEEFYGRRRQRPRNRRPLYYDDYDGGRANDER